MNKILRCLLFSILFHGSFIQAVSSEDIETYNQLNQAVVELINAEVMTFHNEGEFFTCRYPLCARYHRSTSAQVKVTALGVSTLVYIKAEPKQGKKQAIEYVLESAKNSHLSESDIMIFLNLYEARIQSLLSDYRMTARGKLCKRDAQASDVCSFKAVTASYNKEGVERFSNKLMKLKGVKKVSKKIVNTQINSAVYEFQVRYERERHTDNLKSIPSSIRNHPLRKILETVKQKEIKSYKESKSFRSCTNGNIMSPGVESTCENLYGITLAKDESLFVHGGKNLTIKLEKKDPSLTRIFEYRQSGEKATQDTINEKDRSDAKIRSKVELVNKLPEQRVHIDDIERMGPQAVKLKGKAIDNQAIAWFMIYLRGPTETLELISSRRVSGKRFKQIFEIKVNLKE